MGKYKNKFLNIKFDLAISELFKNSITKTASIGNFGDVKSKEDIAKYAKMISKMLELPKYEAIKSRLISAKGVVNFVTHDEYEPLVELLIKSVYSPVSNDIFTGEMGDSDSYFIDAKDYFITDNQRGKPDELARDQLNDLINGTTAKKTRKWFADNGLNDQEIEALYGEGFLEQLDSYGQIQSKLSSTKNRINNLTKEVGAATGDEADKKSQQLNQLKSIYSEMFKRSELIGRALSMRSSDGKLVRNKDGFFNFSPSEEILLVSRDVLNNYKKIVSEIQNLKSQNKSAKDIYSELYINQKQLVDSFASRLELLRQRVSAFNTQDPSFKRVLQAFSSFLGEIISKKSTGENFIAEFSRNINRYAQYESSFRDRAVGHGRVMILKNLENSPLCVATQEGGGVQYILNDQGILSGFNAKINSYSERARSQKEKEDLSKKAILIITKEPIVGLPSVNKVDMHVSPVDIEEAGIIVDGIFEAYEQRHERFNKIKEYSEAEEAFSTNKELNREKMFEKAKSKVTGIMAEWNQGAFIAKSQIKEMITGMGQKDAIQLVSETVDASQILERDNSGKLTNIKTNFDKMVDGIADTINKKATEKTIGMEVKRNFVQFDDYAYKKVSNWARRVTQVDGFSKGLQIIHNDINNIQKSLAEKKSRLNSPRITENEKRIIESSIELSQRQLSSAMFERNSIIANIPHVYLLYGPSGTGKSVWSQALSSLLGFKYYRNIKISAQRSKWVGETEKNTATLVKSVLSCNNTVFLIDEIDRQLQMSDKGQGKTSGGDESDTHGIGKSQTNELLDLLEDADNINKMIKNNIYIVMTTNHLQGIDRAVKSRVSGGESVLSEVELPETPEDYMKLLKSAVDVLERKSPLRPLFIGDPQSQYRKEYIEKGTSTDQLISGAWEHTKQIFSGANLFQFAQALSQKRLDFRLVTKAIQDAFVLHYEWELSLRMRSLGYKGKLMGLPFTTNNLVNAVDYMNSSQNSDETYETGLYDIAKLRQQQMEEIMKQKQAQNPNIKEEDMQVDEDIMKVMNGEIQKQEEVEQLDVEENIVENPETGEKRTQLIYKPKVKEKTEQEKEQERLMGKGFEEDVEYGRTEPIKPENEKEEDKDKKEPVKSSTDYYYNYLKKQGIIKEMSEIIIEAENKKKEVQKQKEKDNSGVYYYGKTLIAPIEVNTPPQQLKIQYLDQNKTEDKV